VPKIKERKLKGGYLQQVAGQKAKDDQIKAEEDQKKEI
jgi:hypothetical protein